MGGGGNRSPVVSPLWVSHDLKTSYLSSITEGEIFPTEVIDDSRRQGVAQHVDHGPKPVAIETGIFQLKSLQR